MDLLHRFKNLEGQFESLGIRSTGLKCSFLLLHIFSFVKNAKTCFPEFEKFAAFLSLFKSCFIFFFCWVHPLECLFLLFYFYMFLLCIFYFPSLFSTLFFIAVLWIKHSMLHMIGKCSPGYSLSPISFLETSCLLPDFTIFTFASSLFIFTMKHFHQDLLFPDNSHDFYLTVDIYWLSCFIQFDSFWFAVSDLPF